MASLAVEIAGDLEAHGHVSSKLERLTAALTRHASEHTTDDSGQPTDGWEYRAAMRPRTSSNIPKLLQKLGGERWELAAVSGDEFYFKRPVRKAAA